MIGFMWPITSAGLAPARTRSSSAFRRRIFLSASRLGLVSTFVPPWTWCRRMVKDRGVEPGVDAPDPRLVRVQGKTPFLQPGTEPVPDHLGLTAAVAQDHEIIRVGDDGRAPGLHVTAGVVADACGCIHAL